MQALEGARALIRDIPLENISGLAKDRFGDTSIIPLWFGEGDVPAPAFIGEAMARAIRDGHVFYTHQNGIPELRETLADYLTGLGQQPVTPDRITVTFSGMNAIMLAVQLACEVGDNLIAVDPVWPNAGGMARLVGAEVRSVRMDHGQGGWTLDPDKVAAAMDGRTRAVFFASPGNPTGAMVPIEIQAELLELCRERGVWLIADEVYNRLAFGRNAAPTILDIAEPEDRLIVINSFSKSWAMTGWRLGWMVHPPSHRPDAGDDDPVHHQRRRDLPPARRRRRRSARASRSSPGCATIARQAWASSATRWSNCRACGSGRGPQAGMYAFFEIDGMPDSRAACLDILAKTSVGLAPGYLLRPRLGRASCAPASAASPRCWPKPCPASRRR